jgi:hypothetical protein
MKTNAKPSLTVLVLNLLILANCNFIPTSVPGVSITGKDVKKELKKTREGTSGLSFASLFGSSSTLFSFSAAAKTCPGYTTDSEPPVFTLPSPSLYSNVNLTGTITASTPQTWTSEVITTAMSITPVLTNSSATCRYSTVSTATTSSGTTITGGSSFSSSIFISTVPAVLSIICYTTSTVGVEYTLSLNPRPSTTSFTSSPFTSIFSVEGLLPDELFAAIAKIDDKEIYTYDSFEQCKKNYENWIFLSFVNNSQAITYFTMCGGYNSPPNQIYFQGATCNLQKAGLIEL